MMCNTFTNLFIKSVQFQRKMHRDACIQNIDNLILCSSATSVFRLVGLRYRYTIIVRYGLLVVNDILFYFNFASFIGMVNVKIYYFSCLCHYHRVINFPHLTAGLLKSMIFFNKKSPIFYYYFVKKHDFF